MIRSSALLVAAALGTLAAGVAASSLVLVYISIAVSILAAIVLFTGVLLRRKEIFGSAAPAGEAVPPYRLTPRVTGVPAMVGGRAKTAQAGEEPGEIPAALAKAAAGITDGELGWPHPEREHPEREHVARWPDHAAAASVRDRQPAASWEDRESAAAGWPQGFRVPPFGNRPAVAGSGEPGRDSPARRPGDSGKPGALPRRIPAAPVPGHGGRGSRASSDLWTKRSDEATKETVASAASDAPAAAGSADDRPGRDRAGEDVAAASKIQDTDAREAGPAAGSAKAPGPGRAGEQGEPEESGKPEASSGKDEAAGAEEAAPVPAAPARSSRDGEPGSEPDKPGEEGDDTGGSGPTPADGEVTVVPGVPRYHRSRCILIRFLGDGDVETMTRARAETANCVPCKACQPDKGV